MDTLSIQPTPWMILPFGALLAMIALGPLVMPSWWARHYPKVAWGLGGITFCYYLVGLRAHGRLLETAHEYVSFIALIGSLYVVSGGIHIRVKGETTPAENTVFLGMGAVLANVLGTTGASMLLIRPWIRMNKYRVTGHHVVFFIFIVSNVGGCLTPIGDPPLFLGYLKGIPFWWVAEHCWPAWLLAVGLLLAAFYAVDRVNFLKAPRPVRAAHAEPPDSFRFEGGINLVFLGVILGAVFIEQPLFLREGIMVGAAVGSYYATRKSIHEANDFNFHPIQEVAILFVGIFLTMLPALDWLKGNAGALLGAQPSPGVFYWGCGLLSSVLDNAPTYLSFLSAIFGSFIEKETVDQVLALVQNGGAGLDQVPEPVRLTYQTLQRYHPTQLAAKHVGVEEIDVAFLLGNLKFNAYIVAISVGAVFFGANTYIGNGPNFMVKAIADQNHVRTPDFLGYVYRYALPILGPILLVVWACFFR